MLHGPLLGKVFRFALPLMLTNLLQMLYNAADMVIAGMSGVEGAIGSIGTTGAMINLFLNLFMGFSVGTNVVVARNIGRGDREATRRTVHTSLVMGVALGAVCGVVGIALSAPILRLLGDEGHVLRLACLYTRIYFLGAPFLAVSNYMIAIFRAKGDTKTPLYILTGTGLLNVGLNLFFVLVCGMSVDGVAVATVVSTAVSVLLLGIRLTREESWCRVELSRLRADREAWREIVRDGLPAGIQGALFSLSNMIIQSSIIGLNNTLCPGGSDVIDGNAAGTNLEGFLYVATNSFCQAAVTFMSQNYGAEKYERIGLVERACYAATGLVAVAGSAIVFLLREPLVQIYVHSPLAVESALTRVYVCMVPYFTLAFMEVGSGLIRGLGRSTTSTVISLLGSCVLRILWVTFVFPLAPSLRMVYWSYPLSWGLTALTHFTVLTLLRRRLLRERPAFDTEALG